jgi:hypothetical protein
MKKCIYLAFLLVTVSSFSQVNLTANLKVCMPFTGNANDISGNSNNGTVNGATLTTDRFGNPNSAYAFGTNMNITLPSFAVVAPTNELTISMWAKTYTNTSNCLFQLIPDNYSDRCVGCAGYSNAGTTMMIFDYGNLTGGRATYTNIPVDHVNWHHYVYVLSPSGNLKQMYRDGVLLSNKAYGLSCVNKNLQFAIGAGLDQAGGPLWFNGYIDDVCIYNRALNSSEVSALYTGTGACFNVGIEELTNIEKGIVYPTSSETGIYNFLMSGMNSESKIEVYGTDGKLIKSFADLSKLNNTIDISNTGSGIYIVKLYNNGKTFSQKLIRN